jgi:hypothetical protein
MNARKSLHVHTIATLAGALAALLCAEPLPADPSDDAGVAPVAAASARTAAVDSRPRP